MSYKDWMLGNNPNIPGCWVFLDEEEEVLLQKLEQAYVEEEAARGWFAPVTEARDYLLEVMGAGSFEGVGSDTGVITYEAIALGQDAGIIVRAWLPRTMEQEVVAQQMRDYYTGTARQAWCLGSSEGF